MSRTPALRSAARAAVGAAAALLLVTAPLPTAPAGAATLAPSNDGFSAALVLPGPTGSISSGQSNVGATAQPGEPQHKPGTPPHASVWYRWTAPITGHVVFRTRGTVFDSLLAVYTGGSLGALTPVANDDDETFSDDATLQSQVNFRATKGVTYRIAVDSFDPEQTGDIALSWTTNDDFASSHKLAPGGLDSVSSVSVDSSGATAQPGEPFHDGVAAGRSLWFSWTAPATGLGRVATLDADFLPDLAVYTGTSVKSLTLVARNDRVGEPNTGAEVIFAATQGTTYRIALSGSHDSSGSVRLQYGVERPAISVGNIAANEGNNGSSMFDFFVGLSAPSATAITVMFSTSDDTAQAGSDYTPTNRTVTFLPGETRKSVTVPVVADRVAEPDEQFHVTLSNPTNATLGATSTNLGFVGNDD